MNRNVLQWLVGSAPNTLRYINWGTTEDILQEITLCTLESKRKGYRGERFIQKTDRLIAQLFKQKQREVYRLYNPRTTLYLDKCFGDYKAPLSERFHQAFFKP